jgi:hypothetical protein
MGVEGNNLSGPVRPGEAPHDPQSIDLNILNDALSMAEEGVMVGSESLSDVERDLRAFALSESETYPKLTLETDRKNNSTLGRPFVQLDDLQFNDIKELASLGLSVTYAGLGHFMGTTVDVRQLEGISASTTFVSFGSGPTKPTAAEVAIDVASNPYACIVSYIDGASNTVSLIQHAAEKYVNQVAASTAGAPLPYPDFFVPVGAKTQERLSILVESSLYDGAADTAHDRELSNDPAQVLFLQAMLEQADVYLQALKKQTKTARLGTAFANIAELRKRMLKSYDECVEKVLQAKKSVLEMGEYTDTPLSLGDMTARGWGGIHSNDSSHQDAFAVNEKLGMYVVCDGLGSYRNSSAMAHAAAEYIATFGSGALSIVGLRSLTKKLQADPIKFEANAKDTSPGYGALTTITSAERIGKNEFALAVFGDSPAYVVDEQGGILRSWGDASAGDAGVAEYFGIDERGVFTANGSVTREKVTLARGQYLVLATDFLSDSLKSKAELMQRHMVLKAAVSAGEGYWIRDEVFARQSDVADRNKTSSDKFFNAAQAKSSLSIYENMQKDLADVGLSPILEHAKKGAQGSLDFLRSRRWKVDDKTALVIAYQE